MEQQEQEFAELVEFFRLLKQWRDELAIKQEMTEAVECEAAH